MESCLPGLTIRSWACRAGDSACVKRVWHGLHCAWGSARQGSWDCCSLTMGFQAPTWAFSLYSPLSWNNGLHPRMTMPPTAAFHGYAFQLAGLPPEHWRTRLRSPSAHQGPMPAAWPRLPLCRALAVQASCPQDARVTKVLGVQASASSLCRLWESVPEKVMAHSDFTQWQTRTEFRLSASWRQRSFLWTTRGVAWGGLSSHRRLPSPIAFITIFWRNINFFLVTKLIHTNCRISGKYREVLESIESIEKYDQTGKFTYDLIFPKQPL